MSCCADWGHALCVARSAARKGTAATSKSPTIFITSPCRVTNGGATTHELLSLGRENPARLMPSTSCLQDRCIKPDRDHLGRHDVRGFHRIVPSMTRHTLNGP